jgi:two-component sensor histidine kinase
MSQLLAIADQDRSAPPASLLLREFSHRINNEFASAIAIVSIASARTESDAAKTALNDVRDRLHSYAQVHRALAMPELNRQIDAAESISRLCQAMSEARLSAEGIELTFVEHPIQLDADRCWQMALVVSELITNSARHAFHRQGGSIRVEISQAGAFVQCIVSDNGCAEGANQPGSGSKILRGLAESLGGTIEQRFGQEGARATLMFPMDPAGFQPRRLDSGAS